MRRSHSFSYIVSLSILSVSLGCEEKKEAAEAPSASVAAVATTPPMPAKVDAGAPKKKEKRVCTDDPVVDFAGDEKLEAQVRLKLDKQEGDIKVADLANVRSLNLSQARVDELDPCIFPHFTNLKDLFLGPGSLEDLSPISTLTKMEALRASLNKVSDVTPLQNLVKMDRLDLGHTQVTDIAPLSNMKELTDLQLDDTPVSDLKPLANLEKLERLSIQRTSVKDVSPLKDVESLKFLYVNGAPVDNVYVLGSLKRSGLKIIDQ